VVRFKIFKEQILSLQDSLTTDSLVILYHSFQRQAMLVGPT